MIMKKLLSVVMLVAVGMAGAQEKEERINRDVEVAENVLSTIIKQQMDKRSSFWPMDVNGSYTPGYGVTLRVPFDNFPMAYTITTDDNGPTIWAPGQEVTEYRSNAIGITKRSREEFETDRPDREKSRELKTAKRDSARIAYGDKLTLAAKDFLADYGDLISLDPNERILITTKSERGGNYNFVFVGDARTSKRRVISVEALKSDLTQYKQGKITRDQLVGKFKVVNTELNDESQPDLELLSTIMNRLYRSDLSKTYFMEGNPYYERMKDFGVTYFMQVYSSSPQGDGRWDMPTVDLQNLDQAARDKKVKELYPAFENDMKSNMLEYGRTLNSLKDDEMLIFDVTLTKCKGCGIPATVEFSVKASVLKEFGAGKLSKDAAVGKINVKKGNPQ
jgi:hypothetical protein